MQNNIDAVNKQRAETGIAMIPHINHPNFGYAITLEDMVALNGERFFEVYNGHPLVHIMGDTLNISTEKMWDLINVAYIESNKPLMYGLATDDSHHYHRRGRTWSNAGRGWIYVQANDLTAESIVDAMENGDFYASTGVELKDIHYANRELLIEVVPKDGVDYKFTYIGYKNGASEPEELWIDKGIKSTYKVSDDVLFVRCKVTSSELEAEPSEYMLYQAAWTQPFLLE
jgi:hypothetical protein